MKFWSRLLIMFILLTITNVAFGVPFVLLIKNKTLFYELSWFIGYCSAFLLVFLENSIKVEQ